MRHNAKTALRWEMQSRDSHLNLLKRGELQMQQQLERERRFATILQEFESQKEQDRLAKEGFRNYQKFLLDQQRVECEQRR